jgi:HD-GYP domain-containing protein (c-di-GMP phosphodiesterase class II)
MWLDRFRIPDSEAGTERRRKDMQTPRTRVLQPQIGIVTLGLALLALGASAGTGAPHLRGWINGETLVLAACLLAAVIASHQYPIHIRHNTKVYVCSIPLYLMVALLPPPLAMTVIGLGIAAGQLLVRRQRGTTWSDTATDAGRWMLLGLLGASVAQLHLPVADGVLREIPLAAAALVLWAGDILSCPLSLGPITKEHPRRIITSVVRQGGMAEAAQHFVGMLGALVVLQQVWALILLALPTALIYLVFRKEMDRDTFQLLEGMADAVDLRDPSSSEHSKRVADLVGGMLAELAMNGPESRLIRTAARLHDLGEIGVPDGVLLKDGLLTPEERRQLEAYPEQGAQLLQRYPDFRRGVAMVRSHHERWDGQGYPQGLAGTEIPFGARVIAVADSFDAMTTDRPYRRALSADRAAAILLEGRGNQWDPAMVDALLRSIAGRLQHPVAPLGLRLVGEGADAREQMVTA